MLYAAAFAKNTSTEAPPATQSTSDTSATIPKWKSSYRIFVTNETTGDLSILDGRTFQGLKPAPEFDRCILEAGVLTGPFNEAP